MTAIILVLLLATTSYGQSTPSSYQGRRLPPPPYNVVFNPDFYRYYSTELSELLIPKNANEDSKEQVCELHAFPPSPQTWCCGIDSLTSNLIHGGNETRLGQYPWLAAIEFYDKQLREYVYRCAGSLISGRYVLSAAHCFANSADYTPMAVFLGDHYLYNKGRDCVNVKGVEKCTDGHQRIPISLNGVITPPYYTPKTDSYNDIALIRLSETARFTDYIRPICLPDFDIKEKPENTTLVVAGWGATEKAPTLTVLNNIKKHVDLPLRSMKVCENDQEIPRNWTRNTVCAGGEKGKDACTGDSGGPLMWRRRGQYFLVGVVSHGYGCGLEHPAVYADVHKYIQWIRKQMY